MITGEVGTWERKVTNWNSVTHALVVWTSVEPGLFGSSLYSSWWQGKPLFTVLPKLKHWWVSGLEILVAIILKQKEHYFCIMSSWKGIEGFGSWPWKYYSSLLCCMFTLICWTEDYKLHISTEGFLPAAFQHGFGVPTLGDGPCLMPVKSHCFCCCKENVLPVLS